MIIHYLLHAMAKHFSFTFHIFDFAVNHWDRAGDRGDQAGGEVAEEAEERHQHPLHWAHHWAHHVSASLSQEWKV